MIILYSGTPGSGKSYHAMKDIVFNLKHSKGVITNFPVATEKVHFKKAVYRYKDNSELTVDYLVDFAKKYHKKNRENQTLLVIDEAQLVFNCRTFGQSDRSSWIKFFSQHRKLGYNVILISQSIMMLDRQIRVLIESDHQHRKLSNYGIVGAFVSFFLMSTIFYDSEKWCAGNGVKTGGHWIRYNHRIAKLYDTYNMFGQSS